MNRPENRWFALSCNALLAMLLCACGVTGGGSVPAEVKPPITLPPVTPPAPGPTTGLTSRPSNTTCLAGDAPSSQVTLGLQRAFANLTFNSPVGAQQAPRDNTRWFVIEQAGRVRVFANNPGVTAATSFVDIIARVVSGGETGLLGMAFHPNFPADPRVFLSYTSGSNPLQSRISEFRSADGGATLDPASEQILLTIDQPAANHNGGHLGFGPDGLLYAGFGDGGSAGDPWGTIGNGQNLQTLLGKLIRIDVNASTGNTRYAIPADNPYAANNLCSRGNGTQNCPEIYAYGLRNPWAWNFDRGSGELWLADVGQDAWEEVDRIVKGGNYGWRCREGAHAFNSNCGPAQNLIEPIAEYSHAVGRSITGGYVYRGSAIPSLVGRYVFGDFVSGRIWHIARDTQPTASLSSGFDSGLQIAAFAEGQDGELLVVNYAGTLHRLVPGGAGGGTLAATLSATGCTVPGDATTPATGVIPYAPNAGFWSSGAQKARFLALPDGQNITIAADGHWDFPNGSVLMKNFSLGARLVETRLLMHHNDGSWAGYTYEWNAQGTDATRVVGGKSVSVAGQNWIFPSESQCLSCHTVAAGRTLGLETQQLNRDFHYASTNVTANEVVTLNAVGVLSPAVSAAPSALPSMPDPYGTAGTMSERARAYLHVNCSQCHRPGGGTPSIMDLRYSAALSATNTCDAVPQAGDLGITNSRLIAPGDAARSVIVARTNRLDAAAMPPIGNASVDTAGVTLLTSWINGLASCN